jgi:hypothetical protein
MTVERLGQRGQARPDLNHGVACLRADGPNDGVDDTGIGQKVLAESLTCNMFHWGASRISTYARPRTSCNQSR